jgi:tetratricopeptide (TPR) repeat protein
LTTGFDTIKTIFQRVFQALLLICLFLFVFTCDNNVPQQPNQPVDDNGTIVEPGSESSADYLNLGLAHMAKGESGPAGDAFTRAIDLDPNLAEAYCYRAINDMESGAPYWGGSTWDRIIADCNKAIELRPDYAKAYDARGFAYHKTGEYEQAVSDYKKSIELDDNDALAYYHRGLLYYQQKQWDLALPDFSKSLELDPKGIHCQYYRGTIYNSQEEWDLAIADLSEVAARASIAWPEPRQELAGAYYQRGMDFIVRGEYDRARDDLNKVIELSADAGLKTQAQQKIEEIGNN